MRNKPKVVVLRWGHRPYRDSRITTHVALTARALGASGLILTGLEEQKIGRTIREVTENWGGNFFVEMKKNCEDVVKEWRKKGGISVHLTAYGENIQTSNVLERIRITKKDVLVIVGGKKVPKNFFTEKISDFNVAIGNQPHSECSSLAIFLDRLFEGKGLSQMFKNARFRIVPQKRGKKVLESL